MGFWDNKILGVKFIIIRIKLNGFYPDGESGVGLNEFVSSPNRLNAAPAAVKISPTCSRKRRKYKSIKCFLSFVNFFPKAIIKKKTKKSNHFH